MTYQPKPNATEIMSRALADIADLINKTQCMDPYVDIADEEEPDADGFRPIHPRMMRGLKVASDIAKKAIADVAAIEVPHQMVSRPSVDLTLPEKRHVAHEMMRDSVMLKSLTDAVANLHCQNCHQRVRVEIDG